MIHQIFSKVIDNVDFYNLSQTTSYLNIYNYKMLRSQPETVEKIDYFTLDGIMMILFLKFFFRKKFARKAPDFSSYFQEMFAEIANQKRTICFIGGSEEDMIKFVKIIKDNYPNLKISHAINGYELQEEKVINQLTTEQVDVVIVGMGTPKQEQFMVKMRAEGYKGAIFSCGAFISQTATGGRDYFPKLINKLHLRWLYRIYKEPKLFQRYTVSYPIALFELIKDFRTGKASL